MQNWNGKLIIAPHPDDELLWCSTQLKGSIVLIVTDGDLGSGGMRDTLSLDEYVKARREESDRVCTLYGVNACILGGKKEGDFLDNPVSIKNLLIDYINHYKPREVYAPCFWNPSQHLGHLILGLMVKELFADVIYPYIYWYSSCKLNDPCESYVLSKDEWEKKYETMESLKTQWHWLWRHVAIHTDDFNVERFYNVCL